MNLPSSDKNAPRTAPVLQNGIAFIILLFLVLSLVSFAALSLSSARADEKLTDKYSAQLTDYYAARNAEQEYLRSYDEAREAGKETGSELITQCFPLSDERELVVVIEPLSVPENGHYYHLLSESVVTTGDYEIDNTIQVFDPDSAE